MLPRAVATGLLVGGASFLVALALLGTPVPAISIGIVASSLPLQAASVRRQREMQDAAGAWPDLLAHVRSSIAAGRTVPDAYLDAARRVGGPFSATYDDVQRQVLFGGGFGSAMDLVRRDFSDATADRVTATLKIADQSGGTRVGEVLASLSASVADELRLRQAHDAAMSEQRWTGAVALIAPWVILALSIATNPQAAIAFDTAGGALVVVIGLAATLVGALLARRSASLSRTPRMFR